MSRLRRSGSARRGGFTLIEIMIAILIIALLAVLLLGAAIRVTDAANNAVARTEIGQLETALAAFKADHNSVNYVPSTIVLKEDCTYDITTTGGVPNTPADFNSYYWLKAAFGKRINLTANAGMLVIDWNGNGTYDGPVTLQGYQCLVYWLGGIPNAPTSATPGTQGWSKNPTNPADSTVGFNKPFYEFKPNRLVRGANNYMSYLDPFPGTSGGTRKPFVYFSSYKVGNDYTADNAAYSVTAYQDTSGRFINPNTYQIISAGKDGNFGPGGSWDPARGYGLGQAGSDDMANFSQVILGAPLK
jgi:general secretion pathway protein G